MKFFDRCAACRKRKLYVRKVTVKLPIGPKAMSKDLFCTSCFTNRAKKALESDHGG